MERDELRIQASDYDVETGHKLEPEEKPAERIMSLPVEVTGSVDQQKHGNLRSSIALAGTVNDFAQGIRSMCGTCKHFDERAWHALKRKMEASKDGVAQLNEIRFALLGTGNARVQNMHESMDGDVDLEHALMCMGVCRPITEMRKDPVVVHPESNCPPELRSESAPHGLYESVSRDADKAGANAFDAIMRRATGEG